MQKPIEAIFENGVLRPLEPLALPECEHVFVTLTAQPDWLDNEYMDACGEVGESVVSLADLRSGLRNICGSMDAAIQVERGEF